MAEPDVSLGVRGWTGGRGFFGRWCSRGCASAGSLNWRPCYFRNLGGDVFVRLRCATALARFICVWLLGFQRGGGGLYLELSFGLMAARC